MITMSPRLTWVRAVTLLGGITLATSFASAPAWGDFIAVNFDSTPVLPLGPTTFPTATRPINLAGVGTFSGGALVGNPTSLASFTPGGGSGNAYGTASFTGSGFANNLTLTAATGVTFSTVTGTLFNGFTDLVSYSVSAFNGSTLLSMVNFADVGDSTDPTGSRNFNLARTSSLGITRLVISADTTFSGGAFDYLLDNVAINYTPAPSAVPEPASLWLLALGLPVVWAARRQLPVTRFL